MMFIQVFYCLTAAAKLSPNMNLDKRPTHSVVTLYLPIWQGGANNEKRHVKERIHDLFKAKVFDYMQPFSFVMEDATKIHWQKEKYAKTILASMDENARSVNIHFYEPCLDSARKLSKIIETWHSGLTSKFLLYHPQTQCWG